MRLGFIVTVFALFTASFTIQAKTILVLGDSISAGYGMNIEQSWVQLLDDRLADRGSFEVLNASVSGDTTSMGLSRLPPLLKQYEPDVVILELGGNDGLRGFPIKVMRKNLEQMISKSQEAGAEVLLVGIQIPPNYGPRYTQEFAEVFSSLAEEHEVAYVPFILDKVATVEGLMQGDGIHPKAIAQPQLLDNVWPYLKPLLAE